MRQIFALIGLLGVGAWIMRRLGFRFDRVPPRAPVPAPQHELYVADMGSNRIHCFEIRPDGRVATTPWRIIDGFSNSITGLENPFDLAVTDAGEVWVANLGWQPVAGERNTPSVTIYDAATSGAMPPTFTISPGFPQTFFKSPVAVAWRENPDGFLLLEGTLAKVWEYSKAQTPTGSLVGLGKPAGLAIGNSGNVYVSDQTLSHHAILIRLFQPGVADQAVTSRIEGPLTTLNNPAHIAVDSQENIYVVNRGSQSPNLQDTSVSVFAAGASGDVAPVQYIRGPNTGLVDPYGITVDATGRIFVTTARAVRVFASGATGNVSPEQVLEHADFSNLVGVKVR